MNYSLPADLWSLVIPISLAVGAIGGLVWDIGNAIHRSRKNPTTGIDNRVSLPSWRKGSDGAISIELGLLGPMVVGAVAGVLLVLAIGPAAPSAEDAAKAVVAANTVSAEPVGDGGAEPPAGETAPAVPGAEEGQPAAPTPTEATEAAEEGLTAQLAATQLVILALLGGLGGWGLLQSMTTRMSSLLESAVAKAYEPASEAGAEAVQEAAKDLGLDPGEQQKLTEAASAGFKEAAETGLRLDTPAPAVKG